MILRARQFEFTFPGPTLLMGIVNVTPDSFSDGGLFLDPHTAVEHALRLADDGADIIDIGGESTRPNADSVSESEELRRVLPVIEQLGGRLEIPISIDTRKPAVARAALAAGASVVNDVEANRIDPEMWEVVADARAGYVAMHMQGSPQTMQDRPTYGNVVRDVQDYFADRLGKLTAAGIAQDQIVLDVGIGFGKTVEHNLELLAALNSFTRFGRPLLLGVSRKSFMGKLFGAEVGARLPAGLACACWAVEAGVRIIRTHDLAPTRQAVRMIEKILNSRP